MQQLQVLQIMQDEEALNFYERVTQGTDKTMKITLEHSTGAALKDVEMHPVSKTKLADCLNRMPDEMFEAAKEAEGEEAEEALEEQGISMNAVSGDTVEAFEDLCVASLTHPQLAPPQMRDIIKNYDFNVLFELGSEIMDLSAEPDDCVKNFHVQE